MFYTAPMSKLPIVLLFVLAACGPNVAAGTFEPKLGDVDVQPAMMPDPSDGGVMVGAPQLGQGDHTLASVRLTLIADYGQGLRRPRDLDFNPRRPDELWIVSHDDDSVLIIFDASTEGRRYERRKDAFAMHFMEKVSAIDFGADATTIGKLGTFGTCHETRNTYDDQAPPNDFMGPTLWSSDLSVFAMSDPQGLGAHLDMLHGSPNCMGIAHERDNIYWVFGGKAHSGVGNQRQRPIPAIVKYNFNVDHGIGADHHQDGEIYQYADMQVKDVPGVPSHLFFDKATNILYIADTGNSRVAKLDTLAGMRGESLVGQEPLQAYYRMTGASVQDVVAKSTGHLTTPSGIEMFGGHIFVSDYATGRISAFSPEGELVNWLDTGLEDSLAGMSFGPDGKLYFVDMRTNRVLRVDPLPQ